MVVCGRATVAVHSAGAGRGLRDISSGTRRAGSVARVCCCVVCLVGNYRALTRPRRVAQPPCCAVLSLFLAVTRLFMLPRSALNALAVLTNATLFLDVVDAGAYVLSCFAALRIPGARRSLSVNPLSIPRRGLER